MFAVGSVLSFCLFIFLTVDELTVGIRLECLLVLILYSFLSSFNVASLSFHFLILSFHRSLDIISDHSPMGMMVQIGSPVCVRINSDNSVFYMGRVIDKKSQPVAYHVNLDTVPENTQEPAVWVSKANIRLLQPPW